MTMKYRATRALHLGRRGRMLGAGKVVPAWVTEGQLKHWLKTGAIEEVADAKPPRPADEGDAESRITLDSPIGDLDFVTEAMEPHLVAAGVEHVGDVEGWDEEDLVELETIGAATAKKLLETFAALAAAED